MKDVDKILELENNEEIWAKAEIEKVCAANDIRGDITEEEKLKRKKLYEAALGAFTMLIKEDVTNKDLLIFSGTLGRLLSHVPLTELEDVKEDWLYFAKKKHSIVYCNRRRPSLFKEVFSSGSIEYSDVQKYLFNDVNDPSRHIFQSDILSYIMNHVIPITFPYKVPSKPIITTCNILEKYGSDEVIVAILDCDDPDESSDKSMEINQYFHIYNHKQSVEEISEETYLQVKEMADKIEDDKRKTEQPSKPNLKIIK